MSVELVSALDLAQGDRILLDSGEEVEVAFTSQARCSKDSIRIHLRGRAPVRMHGYWRAIVRRSYTAARERERDPDRGCYHCHAFNREFQACRGNGVFKRFGCAPKPAPPECPLRTDGQVRGPGGLIIRLTKEK